MIINQFVGTVTPSDKILKEVDGEKFYIGEVKMNNTTMSVVYSEYIAPRITGKVCITGFVRTDRSQDKIFTFINIMNAVPSDEPESARVEFDGKVITIKELDGSTKGKEVLPLIISYKVADGSTTLLHCRAVGKAARQLLGLQLKCGMYVHAAGELHSNGNCVSVFLDSAEIGERRIKENA